MDSAGPSDAPSCGPGESSFGLSRPSRVGASLPQSGRAGSPNRVESGQRHRTEKRTFPSLDGLAEYCSLGAEKLTGSVISILTAPPRQRRNKIPTLPLRTDEAFKQGEPANRRAEINDQPETLAIDPAGHGAPSIDRGRGPGGLKPRALAWDRIGGRCCQSNANSSPLRGVRAGEARPMRRASSTQPERLSVGPCMSLC